MATGEHRTLIYTFIGYMLFLCTNTYKIGVVLRAYLALQAKQKKYILNKRQATDLSNFRVPDPAILFKCYSLEIPCQTPNLVVV